MSFAKLLDDAAREHPGRIALYEGDRSWTYAELATDSRRIARGLATAGVQPGDRVALHMTNRMELAALYFACARLGAVAVPINTRMKPAEIDFVLRHSGAYAYVGAAALAHAALSGVVRTCAPDAVFVLDEAEEGLGARPYAALLADASGLPSVDPRQPAAILYTSGSTAQPKGVVYDHQAIIAGAVLGQPGILAGRVVAQATSMMHAGGFSNLVASVHAGASLVLLQSFDADLVLDAIERRRCSYFAGLPFMFDALVERQSANPRDVRSATVFHAGGDAVTPVLQSRFEAVFGHPLREGYGITEAGRITHQPEDRPVRVGSIGVPIDGVEVRIADARGREARVDQAGELLIRTPGMMSRYWRDPEATSAALQDGWLRSGDIARRDADGYLWFLGRKKEIIVRGGSNIAPQEVEGVLARHPGLLESAVVGLPDAVMGERVVAVVRRRPAFEASEADIISFVQSRLADYKTPEKIIFREDLPKNAGGKVQRLLIRQSLLDDLKRKA